MARRKSINTLKEEANALVVDAAMRWTKTVRGRTAADAEQFPKAQEDLVMACGLRRFLDQVGAADG
jgi:hypothetical protein